MQIITSDLMFPEGPVVLPGGGWLVVEMGRGSLTRIAPDGKASVLAQLGGSPNGAAFGPDGRVYVCNSGGLRLERDNAGGLRPMGPAPDYSGGRIEVVNVETGKAERLYDSCDGRPLVSCNDLVFDGQGGFWFTDLGKTFPDRILPGGIYWARADGSEIRRVVAPFNANGIGISPDGKTLYVAETPSARLYGWEITAPGTLCRIDWPTPHGARLVGVNPGHVWFDSLKVAASGRVCVATLINGGISEFDPATGGMRHYALPDYFVTNLCFGGDDMRTAYVTLAHRGLFVSIPWHEPGLELAHSAGAFDVRRT